MNAKNISEKLEESSMKKVISIQKIIDKVDSGDILPKDAELLIRKELK